MVNIGPHSGLKDTEGIKALREFNQECRKGEAQKNCIKNILKFVSMVSFLLLTNQGTTSLDEIISGGTKKTNNKPDVSKIHNIPRK
ncbi:MAG: hypothetical protein WC774_05795 [Candidatus Gracilibacteria bacterium]